MERNITCIICPRGCSMVATIADGGVTVTGNACPKGQQYAIDECTNPVRTVTATVRVANRKDLMVSVKTDRPVAKDRMMEVMAALRSITVDAPFAIGDKVLEGVCGADIIVTKAVP